MAKRIFLAKKLSIISLFSVLILSVIFFIIHYLPWHERQLERQANTTLKKLISIDSNPIPIRELVNFPFDKVCFLVSMENYVSHGSKWSVNHQLDSKYQGYIPDSRCDSYKQNDLFFIENRKPITVIPINICNFSLSPKSTTNCFSADAVINVLKDNLNTSYSLEIQEK
jgi:hypothetical protein